MTVVGGRCSQTGSTGCSPTGCSQTGRFPAWFAAGRLADDDDDDDDDVVAVAVAVADDHGRRIVETMMANREFTSAAGKQARLEPIKRR